MIEIGKNRQKKSKTGHSNQVKNVFMLSSHFESAEKIFAL